MRTSSRETRELPKLSEREFTVSREGTAPVRLLATGPVEAATRYTKTHLPVVQPGEELLEEALLTITSADGERWQMLVELEVTCNLTMMEGQW